MDKLTEKEIEEYLKKRASFIKTKANIAGLIEPKQFSLFIENISNVRNSIIISGALATMILLVINNAWLTFDTSLLKISLLGFVLAILFYSVYLKESLSLGIERYKQISDSSRGVASRGMDIINEFLDGNRDREATDAELLKIYEEIEYTQIRLPEAKKDEFPELTVRFLAHAGNVSFITGLIALISFLVLILLIK